MCMRLLCCGLTTIFTSLPLSAFTLWSITLGLCVVEMNVFSTGLLVLLFFQRNFLVPPYYFINGITVVLILLSFWLRIGGKLRETSGASRAAKLLKYFHWIFNCFCTEESNSFRGVYVRHTSHTSLWAETFPNALAYIWDCYHLINLFKWWYKVKQPFMIFVSVFVFPSFNFWVSPKGWSILVYFLLQFLDP